MSNKLLKLSFLLILVITALMIPVSALGVSAQSAILYDPVMDRVLFEKNADKKMLIASTTKIMTAVVTLENSSLDEMVTIGREPPLVEGSSMYLHEGEQISVGDLLRGLMLVSGNDAATALALHVGGDIPNFAAMMNDTAARLEMSGSSFSNPHGLDNEKHYSTACDMAKLAAYAMSVPGFAEIVGTRVCNIPGHSMRNHNKLLWLMNGAEGVKTGFTKKAGRCLVSSASREGHRLVTVTLNAPDDWNDHINMTNYGFEHYPPREVYAADTPLASVPVVSGQSDSIPVSASVPLTLALTDEEYSKLKVVAKLPSSVTAPIHKDDRAGDIEVRLDGTTIMKAPLYFASTVLELAKNG